MQGSTWERIKEMITLSESIAYQQGFNDGLKNALDKFHEALDDSADQLVNDDAAVGRILKDIRKDMPERKETDL